MIKKKIIIDNHQIIYPTHNKDRKEKEMVGVMTITTLNLANSMEEIAALVN